MTSLYIDRRDVHLQVDAGALVFRENNTRVGTVPLAPVTRVFLRGQVSLDASVLGKLGENGAGVVVLSGRQGKPSLLLSRPHLDAQRRVQQTRLSLEPAFCLALAREFVGIKISQKIAWFEALRADYPQARHALSHALELLTRQKAHAELAQSLESLRGIEGSAASSYFKGLASVVHASLGFSGRNRRPPRDPFNAMLSLGYTLANAEIAIALHGAGLDPYIGFYHQLSYGRESLANDVLETQRVAIDQMCLDMVASQELTAASFSLTNAGCLMGKAGRVRYYSLYEQAAVALRTALKHRIVALTSRIEATARELP